MKKSILFSLAVAAVSLFGSCANDVEMNYPPTHKLSNLPVVEGVHDGVRLLSIGVYMSIACCKTLKV